MLSVLRIVLSVITVFFATNVFATCKVHDDAGNTLTLVKPAHRLVVLAPDLVENVFAVGAGERIVGVVQGSDYPAAARKLPIVGSYAGIDLEKIITLKPDLIIAWKYAFPRQLAALKRLGVPVLVAAPKYLDDVPRLQREIGCLTGQDNQAENAARQFESAIHQLKLSAYHGANKPTVFFQIDQYTLMTINHDSWINQVIELCGGSNPYAELKVIAPEVSRESLLVTNPDIIFNASSDKRWEASWRHWGQMKAVINHHLFTIHPDLISRAGPRLVEGAKQVCQAMNQLN